MLWVVGKSTTESRLKYFFRKFDYGKTTNLFRKFDYGKTTTPNFWEKVTFRKLDYTKIMFSNFVKFSHKGVN